MAMPLLKRPTHLAERWPAEANEEPRLTYVKNGPMLTYMEKTQIYLRKEELEALRTAAARSGRSVAEIVRDAIRKVVLKPQASGPVAIWDGEPKRASFEHDSVHDEP
jgi:Ribbon-helix-helix protein, copG family